MTDHLTELFKKGCKVSFSANVVDTEKAINFFADMYKKEEEINSASGLHVCALNFRTFESEKLKELVMLTLLEKAIQSDNLDYLFACKNLLASGDLLDFGDQIQISEHEFLIIPEKEVEP